VPRKPPAPCIPWAGLHDDKVLVGEQPDWVMISGAPNPLEYVEDTLNRWREFTRGIAKFTAMMKTRSAARRKADHSFKRGGG